MAYGFPHHKISGFGELDQKRQICSVQYAPARRLTGPQTEVRGRSTIEIRHHDNAVTSIHLVRCRADFALLVFTVIIRCDGNGQKVGLRPYDMLDRGQVFPGQPAMCHDHDPDQSCNSVSLLALQLAVSN